MKHGIFTAILLALAFNIPLMESHAVFYNDTPLPKKVSKPLTPSKPVVIDEEPTREEIAKAKEDKEEYNYLGSSCVRFAHYLNDAVPLVDAKWFNEFSGETPVIGGVIVLKYNAKDGSGEVWHIATITSFETNGFGVWESNFEKGKVTRRVIEFDDPHIQGFWKPANI